MSGGAGRSGCVKGLSQEQQKGLEILKEVMFTLDEEDGLDQVYTFRLVILSTQRRRSGVRFPAWVTHAKNLSIHTL